MLKLRYFVFACALISVLALAMTALAESATPELPTVAPTTPALTTAADDTTTTMDPAATTQNGPVSAIDLSQNIAARLYMDAIGWARVNTNGPMLNLRDMAGARTLILTRIPNGAEVEVLEYGGQWMMIRAGNIAGYAQTAFLVDIDAPSVTLTPRATPMPAPTPMIPALPTMSGGVTSQTEAAPSASPTAYARVNTGGPPIVIRSKPSEDSSVIAIFPDNSILDVVEQSDMYSLVRRGEVSGYVLTQQLALSARPLIRSRSAAAMHVETPEDAVGPSAEVVGADGAEAVDTMEPAQSKLATPSPRETP